MQVYRGLSLVLDASYAFPLDAFNLLVQDKPLLGFTFYLLVLTTTQFDMFIDL